MKPTKSVVALAVAALLASVQLAFAAQQTEQDSAYKWGRWAVLSPAAGGAEPYADASTPGAEFNARPGEAQPFQPTLAGIGAIPTQPGIGDLNPGEPIGNLPLPPPPPVTGGIGDLLPGETVGNLPLPPPPPGI